MSYCMGMDTCLTYLNTAAIGLNELHKRENGL
jgi:hypothetical protein